MGLGDDLLVIHRVVTRALGVALEKGEEFSKSGFPSSTTEKGYRDFARCLVKLVKAHHDGEETIVFPRLRAVLPSVPFEDLERQHHDLVGALDAAEGALDAAESGAPTLTWLDRLVPALGRARETWTTHIALEESHFTPAALDRALDASAQAEISKAAAEDGQKRGHVPQLNVAFILYNLVPADRAVLLSKFPPQLIGLLDGPWKEQWAPMRPFLLDQGS
jgi:hypothetical protein